MTGWRHATVLAAALATGAQGEGTPRWWDDLEVQRGRLRAEVIGRLQLDLAGGSQSPGLEGAAGPLGEHTEARRARLGVQGWYGPRLRFKLEYDWAGSHTERKDALLAWDHGPGIFTVGHHKEPFGLEQWMSTRNTTFVERAAPDVFTPARNTGVSYRHAFGGRVLAAAGAFREADGTAEVTQPGGGAITARLGGLAWRPAPDRLLWLGASLSRRRPPGDQLRVRSRLETHTSGRALDTGKLAVLETRDRALELAWMRGPLSLQAEAMGRDLATATSGGARLQGWYAYVSWVLTGEHRRFKLRDGAFQGIRPRRPWDGQRGGAVELALRFSNLDLRDGPVAGGEQDAWTLGVNWYLHEHTRVQLNYVRPEVDGAGSGDLVTLRFSCHF